MRNRDLVPLRVLVRGIGNRRPACTRCGDRRIRLSTRKLLGFSGFLCNLLGLTVYRCRACTMKCALRVQPSEVPVSGDD